MAVLIRFVCENAAVAAGYWFISYCNWLLFSNVGVMPMPIWPAAALALVVALYRGWGVALGIALGVILTDHVTLGVSWMLAASISVMNTLGPVLGSILIRRKISNELNIGSLRDFGAILLIGLVFVPALTSFGGVGSMFIFKQVSAAQFFPSMIRWAMAHSLGTLLFAFPYLIWAEGRRTE